MNSDLLLRADKTRQGIINTTSDIARQKFSQYLTPKETAAFAASMFSEPSSNSLKCLDLGGGTGILTAALFDRFGTRISADIYELDGRLAAACQEDLASYGVQHRIFVDDVLTCNFKPEYDQVILNPPYKKMAADDPRQAFLPFQSANLYSAFITVAIQALKPGGECVAIVPRSWTNGEYFASFRQWLFENASIDWLHIYGSRTEVFADTNVLQETMIVRFSKRTQDTFIRVTESFGKFDEVTTANYPVDKIICGGARVKVVRIHPARNRRFAQMLTLKERGLLASTGKIVDFRSRDKTFADAGSDRVPLVYACNFTNKGFVHPVDAGKMQWYWCRDEKDRSLLIGPGSFIVVKRFSSKEESKRLKAYTFSVNEPVALENHLNFIHAGKPRKVIPLDDDIAKGLAIWLNSTLLDEWFRDFSGSTQVNASDLNQMPTPDRGVLAQLGKSWRADLNQEEIDDLCEAITHE